MLKKKPLLISLFIAVVAILIGYVGYQTRIPDRFLDLTIGSSYLFSIQYQSIGEFEESVISIDPALLNRDGKVLYEFQGNLRLTPVFLDDDEYTVESELSGLLTTGEAENEFSEFFKFQWQKSGEITGFTFEASHVEENSFLVTDLMESFDISLSQESQWSREVTRRYGNETENYQRESNKSTVLLSVNESSSLYKVKKTSTLDVRNGITANVNALRERTFYGQNKRALSQDKLMFTAKISDIERNFVSQGKGSDFTISEPFTDDINLSNLNDRARQNHVRSRLSQKTPDELFLSIEGHAENRKALISDGYILAAYLEFQPQAVKDLVLQGLTDYSWNDLRFDTIVKNLTYVGNSASQEFLISAINDEYDFRKKAQLIIALGFVQAPAEESFEFMLELAQSNDENTKKQSELMLGAMLSENKKDNNVASEAFSYLVNRLNKASSADEQSHYISALGNSSLADAYPAIEPYLDAENPELKKDAIDALRLIESEEATNSLVTFLSDDDVDMRHAAAEALTYRSSDSSVLKAIEARLDVEVNQPVLKLLLYNLIQEKNNFPEVQGALENFLSTCGVTELCDYVKSNL